jgi:hypothetical protein
VAIHVNAMGKVQAEDQRHELIGGASTHPPTRDAPCPGAVLFSSRVTVLVRVATTSDSRNSALPSVF